MRPELFRHPGIRVIFVAIVLAPEVAAQARGKVVADLGQLRERPQPGDATQAGGEIVDSIHQGAIVEALLHQQGEAVARLLGLLLFQLAHVGQQIDIILQQVGNQAIPIFKPLDLGTLDPQNRSIE